MSSTVSVMTSRLRSPRKSIFEQPEVLDAVHLVLGDDRRASGVLPDLRLALDRQVLGERLVGDDHGGGVDAVLAAQALEALGDVDDLPWRRGRWRTSSRSSAAIL